MPERKKTIKKEMSLNEKLQYIQANLKVPKNQFNKFGNYNYRNCEDILEALKPLLAETKVILTIEDEIILIGNRYYVKAMAILSNTLSIKPNFEVITISAYAREPEHRKGMDEAQITGATSSYARKYALNGLFAIDDARDADTQDNRDSSMTPHNDNNLQKTEVKKSTHVNPDESKVLNLIIETLAPKVETGNIIDVSKLKSVILKKYGQLPTKTDSGQVVIKYILDELGIDNVSSPNDFIKGLENNG